MLTLFEDLHHGHVAGDIGMNLNLVQQGWNTGIYILRITVLELLQSICHLIHETATEELPRVREMLSRFSAMELFSPPESRLGGKQPSSQAKMVGGGAF